MDYHLTMPIAQEDLNQLQAGDKVFLSGVIYTARDAAHGRMMERLEEGEALPFPIEQAGLYYVGPTPEEEGAVIGSAGPTTSGRMDVYTPRLLELGLKIMIGKGVRNQKVKEATVKHSAVYLAALGGAGALMAQGVRACEVVCWEDLGCEAVRKLTVENLPLTVILDTKGGDLYSCGPSAYLQSIS